MIRQRLQERIEEGEKSIPGLEETEARLDATVLMLQLSVSRMMDEARGERMFWADKSLEEALYKEVENVAFGFDGEGKGKGVEGELGHFKKMEWAGMVCHLPLSSHSVQLYLPTFHSSSLAKQECCLARKSEIN
jgi:hypothetical protein